MKYLSGEVWAAINHDEAKGPGLCLNLAEMLQNLFHLGRMWLVKKK